MASEAEALLAWQLDSVGIAYQREFPVCAGRRFRFDFAFPEKHLACEVDGGVWQGGRHTSGAGYVRDCEKANLAAIGGWRVLHVIPQWVKSGEALKIIEQALGEGE